MCAAQSKAETACLQEPGSWNKSTPSGCSQYSQGIPKSSTAPVWSERLGRARGLTFFLRRSGSERQIIRVGYPRVGLFSAWMVGGSRNAASGDGERCVPEDRRTRHQDGLAMAGDRKSTRLNSSHL